MPAHRKTSHAQIIELLVYLEKHKDIQLGTAIPKGLGKRENEHWQKLAQILNSCPGEPKAASKWKSYWNDLKWSCRKKAASGRTLLPYEKRVLNLAGKVKCTYPVYVFPPNDDLKTELKENNSGEKHDNNSDAEMDFADNSRSPANRDQDCTSPDPMSSVQVAVKTSHSDQDDEGEEEERIEETVVQDNGHLSNNDVPEWVRKVEHSRLCLEERTTRAIEQMSAGITSMAETMHSIVGSLQSIEASIRELNKKN